MFGWSTCCSKATCRAARVARWRRERWRVRRGVVPLAATMDRRERAPRRRPSFCGLRGTHLFLERRDLVLLELARLLDTLHREQLRRVRLRRRAERRLRRTCVEKTTRPGGAARPRGQRRQRSEVTREPPPPRDGVGVAWVGRAGARGAAPHLQRGLLHRRESALAKLQEENRRAETQPFTRGARRAR